MTGQVINTNVSSLNAQRNLSTSQSALSQALQRLSSGLRINSAKDDAAGLAISERFTTQIRGLNQAVRNANDGISLAQTAEAALGEVTNNLQRIRELAVQSANATNSASDRAALDAEVQQRLAEIERIATQTSFNSQKVLDGTFGTATFQVGANVGETISLNLATSVRTTAIGKTADYVGGAAYATTSAIGQQGAGVDSTALSAGDITITVGSGQAVSVGAAVAGSSNGQTTSSAYAKAAAINASGISGVTATADTTAQFDLGTTAVAATETDYDLTINSVAIYTSYNGTVNGAVTSDQLVAAINANSATTGVTASYDSSNTRVTLTSSDGRNISVTQGSTTNANDGAAQGLGAAEGTNNTQNALETLAAAAGATATADLVGSIRLSSAASVSIGGTAARIGFSATAYSLGNSALNSTSVTTVANANTTIGRVDAALSSVNGLRSNFGAIQNRFESTIANLTAVNENLEASRSRIRDADFAQETAELTRAQILQQAGVAILAQANALPQNVLGLLR
ncbi:MAG: flagellin [Gammaproteobacteria bacterium]|nr:flagellin [Gammaproteobacteria bacterium]MDH4310680.1 flagellin [Gammaproteobacteria bacterium]MDH5272379.1 flagellin [Gammaproteobacteria bacterium]